MLFLLFLTAQAALPTDWANVYYCTSTTDCLDHRDSFGWAGPAESFVMCRDSQLIESDLTTWNYVLDREPDGLGSASGLGSALIELPEIDPFKGSSDWDVAEAIVNGTVPAEVKYEEEKYFVANNCCPGNKHKQCLFERCTGFRNKKKCNQLKGCLWHKRKCEDVKPAGICDDYKTKKTCTKAMKVKKTLQQPPTDATDKGCMWYNKKCRPYIDLSCKKINLNRCLSYKGCKMNRKKTKCLGKREPIGDYPNYGGGKCEINEECTCFGGNCANSFFRPETPAPVKFDPSSQPKEPMPMPVASCMCIMIGRPYPKNTSANKAINDDWC